MSLYLDLIELSTKTRINDKWFLKNHESLEAVRNLSSEESFKNFDDTALVHGLVDPLFQQAFLHVVTETVFDYPVTFISEKTIKPIINKRPFVIAGPTGTIKRLHNLGFQTFSDFWSEHYDEITDCESRIIAITDIVDLICRQTIDQLQDLCNQMKPILDYNHDHYINDFKKVELSKFEQACIDNLKPR